MYNQNRGNDIWGLLGLVAIVLGGVWVIFSKIQEYVRDVQLDRRFGSHIEEYLQIPEFEKTGAPPPKIGKVVVVDKIEGELDHLYFNLSEGIRAKDAGEVETIVWLECTDYIVGTYEDGTKGYQTSCDVTVIDMANKTIIDRITFHGQQPPFTKSGGGNRYGGRPANEIVSYIERLSGITQVQQATATATSIPLEQFLRESNATATAQAVAEATVEAQVAVAFERASSWPLYRSDAFDSNENGWSTGEFNSDTLSGSRLVGNGAYLWEIITTQAGGWLEVLDTEPVSDFYLTVDVEVASGSLAYQQGLVFRATDFANFYLFALNGNGQYQVVARHNSQWYALVGPSDSSAIRVGETNSLAVLSEGTTLTFYINDTYLVELTDAEFNRIGKVGVMVELTNVNDSATLAFDNFQLRSPHADQLILIESGRQLAIDGEIEEALAIYMTVADADSTFEIAANTWNALCWFGSLWGKAAEVMSACDNAVQGASGSEPDVLAYSRSSRGVARALTGDYSGAIEDFQFFVTWYENDASRRDLVLQREAWIVDLKIGQNPFDEATLAILRDE
jgi:hypothetical protein